MATQRAIEVAVDFSAFSKAALRWAAENILRDGDHLILVNVQSDLFYEGGEIQLWEVIGSCQFANHMNFNFSDPAIAKKDAVKPDTESLDILSTVAAQKKVVIVLKIYWGDAREKICEAVDNIPLNFIVIENKGLGQIKRIPIGSISNHVVNNTACPVVVFKSAQP